MVKRIRVSYGRTCQNAPYESIRLDVAIEKDIPDDANVKEEVDKSVNSLQAYIKAKIKQIIDSE